LLLIFGFWFAQASGHGVCHSPSGPLLTGVAPQGMEGTIAIPHRRTRHFLRVHSQSLCIRNSAPCPFDGAKMGPLGNSG